MSDNPKPTRDPFARAEVKRACFLKSRARDWVNPFLSRNVEIDAIRGLLLDVFERMAGVTLTPEQRVLALARMDAQQVLVMPLELVQTLWEAEPSLKPFCDGLSEALALAVEVMPTVPGAVLVDAAPR